MEFNLETAVPILARTPELLRALLSDLPSDWVHGTEGEATWSPFDVVSHLMHGELTDWMSRVEHLLVAADLVVLGPGAARPGWIA